MTYKVYTAPHNRVAVDPYTHEITIYIKDKSLLARGIAKAQEMERLIVQYHRGY